jgi:hypothetical protein
VHRRGVAGLANLRVQPDIGDESVRIGEATEVADRSDDRHRGDGVHARDGHQSGYHRIGQRLDGHFFLHHSEFSAVEVQLPEQSVHAGAFVGR